MLHTDVIGSCILTPQWGSSMTYQIGSVLLDLVAEGWVLRSGGWRPDDLKLKLAHSSASEVSRENERKATEILGLYLVPE